MNTKGPSSSKSIILQEVYFRVNFAQIKGIFKNIYINNLITQRSEPCSKIPLFTIFLNL